MAGMMQPRRSPIDCDNMNHRRTDSPVPYCPQCGRVVNPTLPRQACEAERHAKSRLQGSTFCVQCGEELIVRRP